MSGSRKILVVQCSGARDDTLGWVVAAHAPKELAGLYGMGDTFHDARQSLAATALLHPFAAGVDAVRIMCVTPKTFDAAQLREVA